MFHLTHFKRIWHIGTFQLFSGCSQVYWYSVFILQSHDSGWMELFDMYQSLVCLILLYYCPKIWKTPELSCCWSHLWAIGDCFHILNGLCSPPLVWKHKLNWWQSSWKSETNYLLWSVDDEFRTLTAWGVKLLGHFTKIQNFSHNMVHSLNKTRMQSFASKPCLQRTVLWSVV